MSARLQAARSEAERLAAMSNDEMADPAVQIERLAAWEELNAALEEIESTR